MPNVGDARRRTKRFRIRAPVYLAGLLGFAVFSIILTIVLVNLLSDSPSKVTPVFGIPLAVILPFGAVSLAVGALVGNSITFHADRLVMRWNLRTRHLPLSRVTSFSAEERTPVITPAYAVVVKDVDGDTHVSPISASRGATGRYQIDEVVKRLNSELSNIKSAGSATSSS
jgi:hypothetical protein